MAEDFVQGELACFFAANPRARQADEAEVLELWRRWIAERVPNLALAHMTIGQVMSYRAGGGEPAK